MIIKSWRAWRKRMTAVLTLGLLTIAVGLAGGCGEAAQKAAQTGVAEAGAAPKQEAAPQTKAGGMDKLRVALVPAEDNEEQIKMWTPVYKVLEQKLGMKIEPFVATDYSGVIEAMRAGHLDVAWYGPFSYVLAAQESGAEAVVLPISEKKGKVYQSYFITRTDTGINKLEDLKGRTFSFGDPASTSGHLIPRYILKKAGIDPEKDFKSVTFSGGHDATGMAVANGKVDAGAIYDAAFDRLVEKKMIDPAKVKIILRSDPIPESPWAVRKDLPADVKERFVQAMLSLSKDAPDALKPTQYREFIKVSDSDYDVIRETAKALNLDLKKMK